MPSEAVELHAAPPRSDALERLVSAVLLVEPSAFVKEQGPGMARVEVPGDFPPATMLMLTVPNAPGEHALTELGETLAAARKATGPGSTLYIVVVNETAHDVRAVIKKQIPAAWAQVRSKLSGMLWSPGAELQTLRGLGSHVLKKAVRRANSGEVADLGVVAAERAVEAAEAQEYLLSLNQRPPVVSWLIAGLCLVVFGLQWLWGGGEPMIAAPRMGAGMRGLILDGQLWRLVAPMSLHANIVHLVMNMIALFSFGTFLERFLGWRRYLLLYVLSGLAGSAASLLRGTETVGVGASGGIWGLMVAGAVLVTRPRGGLPPQLAVMSRKRAWTPVVINAFYSFQPGVDLLAHFGGGAMGALLIISGVMTWGLPPVPVRLERDGARWRESSGVTVAALLGAALLVAGLAVAWVKGRPWELQTTPTLSTVVTHDGTEISLPHLMGPTNHDAQGNWTFAKLSTDPMAVVVYVVKTPLSASQARDPEATLRSFIADASNVSPVGGFTAKTPFALQTNGPAPFLHREEDAADGRRVHAYWLIRGGHAAEVIILQAANISAPWRALADPVALSLGVNPPLEAQVIPPDGHP